MRTIKKGIVFSDDINLIINGNNALDYQYDGILPSKNFFESLRRDFKRETNQIFNNEVTIVSEQEMTLPLSELVLESLKICPHRLLR